MNKIEKLISQFLENPKKLSYKKIEKIMQNAGFVIEQGKGSHKKIINPKTKTHYTIPVHNNDCFRVYKEDLQKIYIDYIK